jgi:arylformamidase
VPVIIPISYPLSTKTPLYPNTPAPVISLLRSIEKGDSANTRTITLSNHTGTHIDAPSHFYTGGATIAECLTMGTQFSPVYCMNLPKEESEEISVIDLEDSISQMKDAEGILIRTGWHTIRSADPKRYCNDHPWISSEVPQFLREKCPLLRLFGIDQISVSSVIHRNVGRTCHLKLLCKERPILILEDLNLSDIHINGSFRLHIYPFMIDDLDGVPVIAIAEIEKKMSISISPE